MKVESYSVCPLWLQCFTPPLSVCKASNFSISLPNILLLLVFPPSPVLLPLPHLVPPPSFLHLLFLPCPPPPTTSPLLICVKWCLIVILICISLRIQVTLVRNMPANAGDIRDMGSISGVRKIPWRRAWKPTPVFLSAESHGQKSLVGYIESIGSHRVRHDWSDLAHTRICDVKYLFLCKETFFFFQALSALFHYMKLSNKAKQ